MRHKWIHGSIAVIMALGLILLNGWVGSASASASDRHIYLAANGANPRSATVAPRAAAISLDSQLFLDGMTWTHWNTRAIGTGTATINLCTPDCAAGKSVRTPVAVTLSAPRSMCGHEFFTSMLITLTGRIPAGLGRSSTVPITPFC
jgi:hypothetical protein